MQTSSFWTDTVSLDKYRAFGEYYFDKPAQFAEECILWDRSEGEGLAFYQKEIMNALVEQERVCARGPHGLGKAQPHDLEIDTPCGRRRFGDLSIGDLVFGSDGQPTAIRNVLERGSMMVYRVIFNDGAETLCSADHLWTVRQFSWEARRDGDTAWTTMPLSELVEHGLKRSNGKSARARKWATPTASPLAYPWRWVPVEPYTLGAWLGDGSVGTGRITGKDREVATRIEQYYKVKELNRKCPVWSIYGLAPSLRKLGVLDCGAHTKRVPRIYLENSVEVRKELLRGLLDTDGTITKEGTISFASVSEQLARDVMWLAHSLGGMARIGHYQNNYDGYWTVLLTLPEDRWFYIERKQERVRPISQKRYLWRWIDRVELVGEMPVRCIEVEAADGLYVANDCIVTHNSALSACTIWWFALTRDALMYDWKVVTTASAWRQLIKYLWPEIHKWGRRINWLKVGRDEPKPKDEITTLHLKLKFGEAFAVASDRPEFIEGAHADHILYLFDESKVIVDGTWDSAEGAMTGEKAYWLAVSTPGEPSGRFYEIQTHQPGLEHWWTRHVTLQEAVDAGRITIEWANLCRAQWGEDSAEYQNRVLGNFAQEEADVLIPLHWIESAMKRYQQAIAKSDMRVDQIGLDVARRGGDSSVIAKRSGNIILPLEKYGKIDTMEASGLVVPYLNRNPELPVVVDVVGVGGGTFDRLTELFPDNDYLFPFHAQAKTDFVDATGQWMFSDSYSAAWWNVREMLDPSNPRKLDALLCLPPDKHLPAELSAPSWKVNSAGKIQVEQKEKVKDRLGRSPDSADAVVMACWGELIQDAEFA